MGAELAHEGSDIDPQPHHFMIHRETAAASEGSGRP
jgi:hypothetical protein